MSCSRCLLVIESVRAGKVISAASQSLFCHFFFQDCVEPTVCGDRRIRSHLLFKVLVQPIDASPGRVIIHHEWQDKSCIKDPRPVDYFPEPPPLRYQDVPGQNVTWQLPPSALPLLGILNMPVGSRTPACAAHLGQVPACGHWNSLEPKKGPNLPQINRTDLRITTSACPLWLYCAGE